MRVYQTPLDHWPLQDTAAEAGASAAGRSGSDRRRTCSSAAVAAVRRTGSGHGLCGLFNGKIDNPTIIGRALGRDEIAALREDRSSLAGDRGP